MLSVLVGSGLAFIRSTTARHLYSLVTGILLVYYPFGAGVLHALPPAILTYTAMLVLPRSCGRLAWMINFPYLLYLHVSNASAGNWNKGQLDFTGGEMVLVLKLIALAMCHQDSLRKDTLSEYQTSHLVKRVPTPLEYASFIFSFGNLLAGPCTEFRDYKDFIEAKGVWDPKTHAQLPAPHTSHRYSCLKAGLKLIGSSILFMVFYTLVGKTWNNTLLYTPWYLEKSVPVKLLLMIIVGNVYQTRYFFAWKLSEASLTFAGLNLRSWDPKLGPIWGRYCNAKWVGVLFSDSGRVVPGYWNIGTGNFLRRYVYERITPKNRKPTFKHLLFTQLVSGLWHGLHPGYLMFFASSSFWIYSATALYKMEQGWPWRRSPRLVLPEGAVDADDPQLHLAALRASVALAQELEFHKSLAVWREVLFIPHITMFVVIAAAAFMPRSVRETPTAKEHAKEL
ncbi:MAG: hypothetical protein WDW36_008759 [Sanguina aurantia]